MYKGASQGAQTHLQRQTVRDGIISAASNVRISEAEESLNHKRVIADLEHQLMVLPKDSAARKVIAARKRELELARVEQKRRYHRANPPPDHGRIQVIFRKLLERRIGKDEIAAIWAEADAIHKAETR